MWNNTHTHTYTLFIVIVVVVVVVMSYVHTRLHNNCSCCADGACTFPTHILGSWVRGSDRKTLTFSTSAVSGLGITFDAVSMDSFNCDLSSDTKFVIR